MADRKKKMTLNITKLRRKRIAFKKKIAKAQVIKEARISYDKKLTAAFKKFDCSVRNLVELENSNIFYSSSS